MTTRAAKRVDEWESRPFTDGYEQLRTLADRSFSGAITAGRATLYMVKGTAVGVLDGTIADFEDATGTIYEAPTPALALLAVMQERSDEVRAKYYSEETPLSEADGKLSEGGFTGYVELSENVLSGDYYVVYQAGKSMSVAFLGESGRLVSGEDAFERANEEVGIYKVRPVAIDPIEIPEPEPPSDDAGTASEEVDTDAASGGENGDAASEEDDTDGDQPADDASESVESKSDPSRAAGTTGETDAPDQSGDRESATAERNQRGGEHPTDATESENETASTDPPEHETERTSRDDQRHERDSTPAHDDQRHERERTARDGQQYESERASHGDQRHESDSTQSGSRESRQSARDPEPRRDRRSPDAESAVTEHVDDSATRAGNAPDSSGDTSLERRTIPSVDPDRTWTPDDDRSAGGSQYERPAETPTGGPSRQSASTRRRSEQPSPEPEEARAEIDDLEQRIEELEASRSELQAERDELQAQLQQVRQERDDLQGEVQRLRKQIAELEDRLEAAEASSGSSAAAETPPSTTGSSLSPREAIAGTNLFVRYGSKSDATLLAAHDGGADADAVNANLSLEYHTEFDDSEATVEGEPYESFLEDTIHYQFVEWFVHKLLYEIRDTGHRSALEDLYDAIPRVDRVEFDGTVTVGGDDEETPGNEPFDVVVRDRMGNPLVVTNLDDSRTATTEEMMTTLVTAATRTGETHDRLAGAFFVTSSFFDPDALETAAEATGGGILSRDKRESFVRLSRKDGFHLCLVESRDDDFHLSVPEL